MNHRSNPSFRPPRRGFTLVELLVTVAIVIVLAALSFLGLRVMRAHATAAIDANDMRSISSALVMYCSDNNDQLPTTWAGVGPIYRRNGQSLMSALAPYFGPEEPENGTFYPEFAAASWQGSTRDETGPSLLVMHNVYSGRPGKHNRSRPSPHIKPFGYPRFNGREPRDGMTMTSALAQMSDPADCLMLTENDTLHPNYRGGSIPGWMHKLPEGMAHGDYRLGLFWDGHVEKLDIDLNRK